MSVFFQIKFNVLLLLYWQILLSCSCVPHVFLKSFVICYYFVFIGNLVLLKVQQWVFGQELMCCKCRLVRNDLGWHEDYFTKTSEVR